MIFRVHYMRPEWFRSGILGTGKPNPRDLSRTHIYLREVEVSPLLNNPLDAVFHNSQGEVWSPNGEARELIQSKGLQHTSMSVGDVIESPDGKLFLVACVGFEELRR